MPYIPRLDQPGQYCGWCNMKHAGQCATSIHDARRVLMEDLEFCGPEVRARVVCAIQALIYAIVERELQQFAASNGGKSENT